SQPSPLHALDEFPDGRLEELARALMQMGGSDARLLEHRRARVSLRLSDPHTGFIEPEFPSLGTEIAENRDRGTEGLMVHLVDPLKVRGHLLPHTPHGLRIRWNGREFLHGSAEQFLAVRAAGELW